MKLFSSFEKGKKDNFPGSSQRCGVSFSPLQSLEIVHTWIHFYHTYSENRESQLDHVQ